METTNEQKKKRDFLLPGSILVAALLISISLVYSTGKKIGDNDLTADLRGNSDALNDNEKTINIRPISSTDHIYGDSAAPVKIIEFSDLECQYCKNFHSTLKQAVSFYDGKVAWVYRHFPLDVIHSKARKEAEASECAAELGGNEKFWSYLDRLFEITPSNNGLDLNKLPQIAQDIGLDKAEFEKCLTSGRHAKRIQEDLEDAQNALAEGTPYSIVLTKNGEKYVIPGAYSFTSSDVTKPSVKAIIEEALKK